MTDEIVEARGVFYTYPNGVEALRGVDLTVRRHDYLAIVGQNGSGKTTLAKHFNGLLKATRGEVHVAGRDAGRTRVSELARVVGYVFQNPDDMLFCSSVAEEIGYGPRMLGLAEAEVARRVKETLAALELDDLAGQHPFALSLGDRQRVAVGCALSLAPEVFVFDEPTTGQDFAGGQAIMALIDGLHAAGRTIVIITHDMRLVAEHSRRVVVMSEGRVAMDGAPGEVFSQVEALERLALRPPPVTWLARCLGWCDPAVLTVGEMCDRLEESQPPAFVDCTSACMGGC